MTPELREQCTRGDCLSAAAGGHSLGARDLLAAVVHAPNLGGLMALRTIHTIPTGPGLTLSLEEVHMYARLLHPDGSVRAVSSGERLAAYASARGIVIDDVTVGLRSLTLRVG